MKYVYKCFDCDLVDKNPDANWLNDRCIDVCPECGSINVAIVEAGYPEKEIED